MTWEKIESERARIAAICRKRNVKHLSLFGSAASEHFDPERSDVDFLVEFAEMAPTEYADTYFGLLEDLENLLSRRVDLITESSVHNPYFRRAIEESRTELYAA